MNTNNILLINYGIMLKSSTCLFIIKLKDKKRTISIEFLSPSLSHKLIKKSKDTPGVEFLTTRIYLHTHNIIIQMFNVRLIYFSMWKETQFMKRKTIDEKRK